MNNDDTNCTKSCLFKRTIKFMRNVAWGARILPVFFSFKHTETKKTADFVTFTEELF